MLKLKCLTKHGCGGESVVFGGIKKFSYFRRLFLERIRKFAGSSDFLWILFHPRLAIDWYKVWRTVPVVSWVRAAHAFLADDFRQAAALYQKGLRLRPDHPASISARLDIAYCHYRLQDYDLACTELEPLISQRVNLKDVYLLYAKICSYRGQGEKAYDTLALAREIFSEDVAIIAAFLNCALDINSLELGPAEAYSDLKRLKMTLDLNDNRQVVIDTALANYELRLGDEARGDRLLARALATGRAPVEAVILRGERLLNQHRILAAREQLSRALQIAPKNPLPLRLLAESYLLAGDFNEPQFALQLATGACQAALWQDSASFDVLARACRSVGETNMADLYEARQRALSANKPLKAHVLKPDNFRDLRFRNLKW